MFAGPNGSGKSTLKSILPPKLLGVYINADEIERDIRLKGFLDFDDWSITAEAHEILAFFHESILLRGKALDQLEFADNRLTFSGGQVDSYFASTAGEWIRNKLMREKVSFTFETVMSHPGKLELLKQAQRIGYRTYLYYIATDDPAINVARVHYRVSQGGHAVPDDKVVSRYYRSLDLLLTAIRHTHRAYIFDNSGQGQGHALLAEITDGHELVMRSDLMPAWFKQAVWDKIQSH